MQSTSDVLQLVRGKWWKICKSPFSGCSVLHAIRSHWPPVVIFIAAAASFQCTHLAPPHRGHVGATEPGGVRWLMYVWVLAQHHRLRMTRKKNNMMGLHCPTTRISIHWLLRWGWSVERFLFWLMRNNSAEAYWWWVVLVSPMEYAGDFSSALPIFHFSSFLRDACFVFSCLLSPSNWPVLVWRRLE